MARLIRRPLRAHTKYPCPHCGVNRIDIAVGQLVQIQRRTPLPGFTETLELMAKLYGFARMVYVCTKCICVTADAGDHSHVR
jgi:DNA-directed RNA polymerase subunit RPC12/RpoP